MARLAASQEEGPWVATAMAAATGKDPSVLSQRRKTDEAGGSQGTGMVLPGGQHGLTSLSTAFKGEKSCVTRKLFSQLSPHRGQDLKHEKRHCRQILKWYKKDS